MPLTEWPTRLRPITSTQSHWFAPGLIRGDTGVIVLAPFTTQYGTGTPPWTVTLTATALDRDGNPGTPIPLATYTTGFDFQVASASEPNGQIAVVWTVAGAGNPASHAVDIQARLLDSAGHPTSGTATLLSGIANLQQFRLGSVASNGSPTLLAYSVFDPATQNEQVKIAGFGPDGTAIPADSRVLDSFRSYGGSAGFGFGTLTPATSATPSFVYLRDLLKNNVLSLGYQTIGLDGAPTGALTPIPLSFDPNSTNGSILTWVWSRLDGAADGRNLATASLISDTPAGGGSAIALDIHILSTSGGPAADDVVPLSAPSRDLAITQLRDGGFVVGFVDNGVTRLRQYTSAGDLIGEASIFTPDSPGPLSLTTLPDGRLAVVFPAANGTVLDEDVFTPSEGPVAYRVDAGVTRSIALLAGDSLTVKAGGTVKALTAAAGAQGINVLSGGTVTSATLNGGTMQVLAGGRASRTTLFGPASQGVVTGGTATATIINASGRQDVAGTSTQTVINASGTQSVFQAGRDFGTTVNAGGTQMLNGFASGTVVSGGFQSVAFSALAVNATIVSGDQEIGQGGRTLGTTVRGGTQDVDDGGTAINTVVQGGSLGVQAGGAAFAVTADAGATIRLAGGRLYATGTAPALTLAGGHLVATGSAAISGATVASGTDALIEAVGGTLDLGGPVTGPVALQADAGTTLILEHGASSGTAFSFAGTSTLQLNELPTFSGSIAHLTPGDAIDLRPLADTASLVPSLGYAAAAGGGTLTVSSGGKSASLALVGTYTSTDFHLASDLHGGTLVRYG